MDNRNLIFHQAKTLCSDIIEHGDEHSIKTLELFIDSIRLQENNNSEWISGLTDFTEYLSFPLLYILKRQTFGSGRQQFLETILHCFNKILDTARDIGWNFFYDAFTLLCKHLSSYEEPSKVGSTSEECKLEALQAFRNLCKVLDSRSWIKMCSESFKPPLGHTVFLCLQIATKEKNRSLRESSLRTIECLALKEHETYLDPATRNAFSLTFANFLPGISQCTTRIANADETEGHKIPVAALKCWSYVVILVMRDNFLKCHIPNLGVSKIYCDLRRKLFPNDEAVNTEMQVENKAKGSGTGANKEPEPTPKFKSVTVDADWLKRTEENISVLMRSISSQVSHSHWKVRMTLAELARNVLQSCSNSLNKCLEVCIELLITLTSDCIFDVSQVATGSLEYYQQHLQEEQRKQLNKIVEDKIFYLTSRLPTIMKTQDDSKVLSSLRLLDGCFRLMGGAGISKFVLTPVCLQRLLRSLCSVLTYDTSDSDLLLERMISEDPLEIMSVKPELGLSFRFFQSKTIFQLASCCCKILGAHENMMLVTDHCLDLAQESKQHVNESYLILGLIVKGAYEKCGEITLTSDQKEKIVSSILDVIMSQKLFDVPIDLPHSKDVAGETVLSLVPVREKQSAEVLSVSLAKSNVILISNLLAVCGNCSLFLGEQFKVFISHILCSVLEKAEERNVLVAYSASLALQHIATACNCESIPKLIEMSLPLFWYSLSQKLKYLPDNPNAPQILKFILKCNRKDMTPFIEDLVDDVLECLDSFHAESAVPLLVVLLAFVEALALNEGDFDPDEINKCEGGPAAEESLLEFVRNLDDMEETLESHLSLEQETTNNVDDNLSSLQTKPSIPNRDEEGMNEAEDADNMEVDPPEKAVPRNVEYVVRILEKCSYLLFVQNRQIQLIILEIIKNSVPVLCNWENQMLPAYHKLWKPLILRLKGKDFIILLKALETCVLMVNSSGTFLKRRCLQELFPNLLFFLQSQSSASRGKRSTSDYFISPGYKAQKWTLEQLPGLIRGLDLRELEVMDLLEVIVLYLDAVQPPCLIQLALKVTSIIRDTYPDLLWLTFSLCMDPFVIESRSPHLKNIKIRGKKRLDFHPLVQQMYEELSSND